MSGGSFPEPTPPTPDQQDDGSLGGMLRIRLTKAPLALKLDAGLRVSIDGHEVDSQWGPNDYRLSAGPHQVSVSSPDTVTDPAAMTIQLGADEVIDLRYLAPSGPIGSGQLDLVYQGSAAGYVAREPSGLWRQHKVLLIILIVAVVIVIAQLIYLMGFAMLN